MRLALAVNAAGTFVPFALFLWHVRLAAFREVSGQNPTHWDLLFLVYALAWGCGHALFELRPLAAARIGIAGLFRKMRLETGIARFSLLVCTVLAAGACLSLALDGVRLPWEVMDDDHSLSTACIAITRLALAEIATILFFLQFAIARELKVTWRREKIAVLISILAFVALCALLSRWYWALAPSEYFAEYFRYI